MRINKFIALALGTARRKADEYIISGKILVDNKIAKMGQDIEEGQLIELLKETGKQKLFIQKTKPKVVLFYKPTKIITSHENEGGSKSVFDLLPEYYRTWKFAGRLDLMSEGLLVLSNDGGVVQTLTHPRYGHTKKYIVVTERLLKSFEIEKLQRGIELDGYYTKPSRIVPLMQSPHDFKRFAFLRLSVHQPAYVIELSEGRNQQIRKMLFSIGTKAKRLIRVEFGRYKLTPEILKGKLVELDYDSSPYAGRKSKKVSTNKS